MSRLALILGNANYCDYWSSLINPINDAKAMDEVLKKAGFKTYVYSDLTFTKTVQIIADFGRELQNFTTGLFFYAGHGFEIKGENYIVPVDAVANNEFQVEYACVNLNKLMGWMSSYENNTNIIIIDACRINPFKRANFRGEFRAGFSYMAAPKGTIISYSTSPNQLALGKLWGQPLTFDNMSSVKG